MIDNILSLGTYLSHPILRAVMQWETIKSGWISDSREHRTEATIAKRNNSAWCKTVSTFVAV